MTKIFLSILCARRQAMCQLFLPPLSSLRVFFSLSPSVSVSLSPNTSSFNTVVSSAIALAFEQYDYCYQNVRFPNGIGIDVSIRGSEDHNASVHDEFSMKNSNIIILFMSLRGYSLWIK